MVLVQVATPVTAAVVAGFVVLVLLARTRVHDDEVVAPVAVARRHAFVVSVLAVGLGVTATGLMLRSAGVSGAFWGVPGTVAALSPLVFGATHCLAIGVGELTWPRPDGAVRRARVEPRTTLSVARGWPVQVLVAATAAAVVTLIIGAALAGPDGRSIGYGLNEAPNFRLGQVTAAAFPGASIGVPVAVGLVVLAVLTGLVLHAVAVRPAVGADDVNDRALRAASAFRVIRGSAAAVLVVDGGLWFFAGFSAVTAFPAGWVHGAAWVIGVLGIVTGLAGLALLCVPGPRVTAVSRAPAALDGDRPPISTSMQ